jgi:hypothetical protein
MEKEAVASEKVPLLSMCPASVPLPEQPVFGHFDQSKIVARRGDRISVSGWAVSQNRQAPVREVRMILDGREIGVFRDFLPRPDVAATYGRTDFLRCGWRGMLYVPMLRRGEYTLIPEAHDTEGNVGVLPASLVTITE